MKADQNENSVANFVQKTFEILSVQIKTIFRIISMSKLYTGAVMERSLPSRIYNSLKKLSFRNTSVTKISTVSFGK